MQVARGPFSVTSTAAMPRRLVVIAGVSKFHILVSATSTKSAASVSRSWVSNSCERRAAAFLLAFQQNGQADRQCAVTAICAAGLEKADHLAFVVHRTARDDPLAARAIHQLRVERVGMPEFQRVGGCTS
jgi:hypothetical protein